MAFLCRRIDVPSVTFQSLVSGERQRESRSAVSHIPITAASREARESERGAMSRSSHNHSHSHANGRDKAASAAVEDSLAGLQLQGGGHSDSDETGSVIHAGQQETQDSNGLQELNSDLPAHACR